jgi:triosephosphate isomerase (TIM)
MKVIVNFKSYTEALGENAVRLAEKCAGIDDDIVVVPSLLDIATVIKTGAVVFSPHVDAVQSGAFTGHITAGQLAKLGVKGTLLNHSEKPVSIGHMKKAVELCAQHEIITVVCAATLEKIRDILNLCSPDYIAYEPADLIGGDVSVTSAEPEIVKKAAILMRGKTTLLCGAGVKSGEDVRVAKELGAVGVLIASGVVKAESPEMVLRDIIKGQ